MGQCNFISQTEVGWDPWRPPSPKPLLKQGHQEQVAQDRALSWEDAGRNELGKHFANDYRVIRRWENEMGLSIMIYIQLIYLLFTFCVCDSKVGSRREQKILPLNLSYKGYGPVLNDILISRLMAAVCSAQ